MKFKTFYTLFYRHRFEKANFIRKLYLILTLPFKYILNYFYLEKKINLDEFSKKNSFLFSCNLDYLFEFFNSDKGKQYINQYSHPSKKNSIKIQAHGYSRIYEKIFSPIKSEKINILEIGSFYGNASAALYFYFKNASIYGADINPDMFNYSSKRIKSFFVNSSSLNSLKENILIQNIKFQIIIEDASHMLKDQIISLFYLFPIVQSGGYFIIEELDFPETREDMRFNQKLPDLKTILKCIKENEDFNSIYLSHEIKSYLIANVDSIEIFEGNMNEIAIIKKK
tara:strand:- start:460 stop:1308 length:849 start_codon:yes stop_codon:yes gene_type:complete